MLVDEVVVVPKVLAALLKITVPVVPLLKVGDAVEVPLLIIPERVNTLPLGALIVAAPVIVMLLLKETLAAPACNVVPAAIASELVPSALLFPTMIAPLVRVVTPV